MRRLVSRFMLCAVVAGIAGRAGALEFGQPLPANADTATAIQGALFDAGTADTRPTLVVFWSTQAPDAATVLARASALARRHAGKLRVAAFNSVDDETAIRDYLAAHATPDVVVARDPENATLLRYLPRVGPNQNLQVNLPVAFLGDAQGRLIWSDDRPLGGMGHVVDQAVSGEWTMATTAQFAQARAEWRAALQADNVAAAYLAIRKLTKLDAGNPANYAQWHRLAVQAREINDLDEIFAGWDAAAADNPEMLLLLANTAMGIDNLQLRRPRQASAALLKAYKLRSDDARFVLQLAAAYHRVGNLQTAIRLLQEAITKGADDWAVGVAAAPLRMAIYGPDQAVKLLENWRAPAGSDAAKLLAEHLAYYRLLVELAANPVAAN